MDGGIGEAAAVASIAGSGLSLASLGMKSGSDIAAGYAKAQEAQVRGQNYLLDANTKATNYRLQGDTAATNFKLQGDTAATNYLAKGKSDAANYRYAGDQQKTQFGLESQHDLMQADQAETAAKFGKLQADMTDASAREQLTNLLGNITTTRLAGGTDFTSPTTAALEGHVNDVANLNRSAAVTSINTQTAEETAAANYLHEASAFALTQGDKAQQMGEYNAENAENYGKFNADTAKSYADYNADTAKSYADYNANTAMQYGLYNAAAASASGGNAITAGYLNSATDILGGLGKAFASAGPLGGAATSVPGTDTFGAVNTSVPF